MTVVETATDHFEEMQSVVGITVVDDRHRTLRVISDERGISFTTLPPDILDAITVCETYWQATDDGYIVHNLYIDQ